MIELSKIHFSPSQYKSERFEKSKGKNIGFNQWKPNGDIGPYKYILTNISRVQSHTIGIEGRGCVTLPPQAKIEFEGHDDFIFEYWTGKLILQGEIELKIEKTDEPSPIEENKYQCSMCEKRISPRNKNGICLSCRKDI